MAALTRDTAPTREIEAALAPIPAWAEGGSGSGNVGVLKLLRVRDRMKEQLMEYKMAVIGAQESFLDPVSEEKLIDSVTEDLQKDVDEVKISFQNKTLALHRIQIMHALRNKVYQGDEDSRLILETMKRIVLLSRKIIECQQQAHQEEQQLIDIKIKRLSLKKDEGEKLQQMCTIMESQKEEQEISNVSETERMLDKLEKERQMTTVIQNVFQNVIIGSGVNWAEDPSLKAVVLQLEKNVYLE